MSKCNSLYQDQKENEMETLAGYFTALDALREGGSMNMWGAGDYLKKRHGASEDDSRKAHALWMETFDGKSSAEDRAAEALQTRDSE